ncbi:MAG TPA: POTRA domain-containing protein [Vicinamibacterales bacterium]|nr:POTRA domain-containing protein [Vicinamibacterales bacterium]
MAAPRLACLPRSCRGLVIGAILLAAAAAPLAAQAPPPFAGERVVAVRVVVDGQPTDDRELLRVLDTPVGAPLSARAVRESIVHLMALGRFEHVEVSAVPAPGGVILTYATEPRQVVTGMDFEGDLGLGEGRLRSAIIERFAGTPPVERAADAAAGLQALLQERGFREAGVRARIRPEGRRAATLVFDVAAGPRVRVASLKVDGAGTDERRVASRLGLTVGAPFDSAIVLDRIDRYTDALRARGSYEARVDLARSYSEDGRGVHLLVDVNLGPHVTLVFRGDPIPSEVRERFLPLDREGGLDEDRLEDASLEFERYLRRQGYREATAPYTRERSPDGRTLLVFTIRRGPQYRIAEVVVEGNEQLRLPALTPILTTAEGQWFVQSRVDADLARLAEEYRRRGFRDVKIAVTVAPRSQAAALLTVRFTIDEGRRITIGTVSLAGNEALPAATLRSVVQSLPGAPFYQQQIRTDRDAILQLYLDRGYQLASVEATTAFDAEGNQAELRFEIHEGPRVVIDRVLVVGNQRTDALMIERETGLARGMPVSLQALADARRRLASMGLFRRVQVSELEPGTGNERDVIVLVEEGPVNSIGYGGGVEGSRRLKRDAATGRTVEDFDVTPRGFFEIGRRNLWGRNRTVNLFARAAIRSSDQVNTSGDDRDGSLVNPLEDTGSGFREYRLLGTYREPSFLRLPVDLTLSAVLDQAIRSSFDFNRRQAYLEGSHRFARLGVAGRYSYGHTRLFNERIAPDDRLNIDRLFNPGLRLSTFSASSAFDTRDDSVAPTRGALLLFDAGIAARRVGSDVGFVRSYGQAFLYREIPRARGTVLAAGVRVGLAKGFPRLVPQIDEQGKIVIGPDGAQVMIEVENVPASERFFAGGDTTVRGFAQDQLGSAEVLDRNGVSNGGQGVLIFNSELRFPILGRLGLGGAAFVDVGNIFARATDMDLTDVRTTVGVGLRWSSPVGPLRLDLGWKVTRRRFVNGERESGFAPHIMIGQAF